VASEYKTSSWNPAKETPEEDDSIAASDEFRSSELSGDAEESTEPEFDLACASRAANISFFFFPE
jgi:hypothetical protein